MRALVFAGKIGPAFAMGDPDEMTWADSVLIGSSLSVVDGSSYSQDHEKMIGAHRLNIIEMLIGYAAQDYLCRWDEDYARNLIRVKSIPCTAN